jgi:NAD(P)-dependent dehydrogenase (short-subunit alcohol dehydrogenase family)
MLSFASGCVVITGGGGLLGRGLALCRPAPPIARRGAGVVVTDVNGAAAQAVAAEAAAVPGARALAVTADVTDRASMDALAETASDAFGSVRVLRNNAGVTSFPLPSADWYRDNCCRRTRWRRRRSRASWRTGCTSSRTARAARKSPTATTCCCRGSRRPP